MKMKNLINASPPPLFMGKMLGFTVGEGYAPVHVLVSYEHSASSTPRGESNAFFQQRVIPVMTRDHALQDQTGCQSVGCIPQLLRFKDQIRAGRVIKLSAVSKHFQKELLMIAFSLDPSERARFWWHVVGVFPKNSPTSGVVKL